MGMQRHRSPRPQQPLHNFYSAWLLCIHCVALEADITSGHHLLMQELENGVFCALRFLCMSACLSCQYPFPCLPVPRARSRHLDLSILSFFFPFFWATLGPVIYRVVPIEIIDK